MAPSKLPPKKKYIPDYVADCLSVNLYNLMVNNEESELLTIGDNIASWINDNFEATTNYKDKQKLKDLYESYKLSKDCKTLQQKIKKDIPYKLFLDAVKNNKHLLLNVSGFTLYRYKPKGDNPPIKLSITNEILNIHNQINNLYPNSPINFHGLFYRGESNYKGLYTNFINEKEIIIKDIRALYINKLSKAEQVKLIKYIVISSDNGFITKKQICDAIYKDEHFKNEMLINEGKQLSGKYLTGLYKVNLYDVSEYILKFEHHNYYPEY